VKGSAQAEFCCVGNRSVVMFNQITHNQQAETAAAWLASDYGFKDSHPFWNAIAGISDVQVQPAFGRKTSNRQGPAIGHRLDRVVPQVEKNLPELISVARNRRQIQRDICLIRILAARSPAIATSIAA